MVNSNHIAHYHEEGTKRVLQTSQGTNLNRLQHFDAISAKLEEFMTNPQADITPQLRKYIISLDCPHLSKLLEKSPNAEL